MKQKSSVRKTARNTEHNPSPNASAGPNGIAIAPPAYGMDMVDRVQGDMVPEPGQEHQPLASVTWPASDGAIQRKEEISGAGIGASRILQENKSGLPDHLKAGIETLSDMPMDDVKVHYNSAQPAQLQALAYTQGTDIYIGSGQEKHLPHEAWHVVQQKQGRVKPTMELHGTMINDDAGLEHEADVMGTTALQKKRDHPAAIGLPERAPAHRSFGIVPLNFLYTQKKTGKWDQTAEVKQPTRSAIIQTLKAHGSGYLNVLPQDRAPDLDEQIEIKAAIDLAVQRINTLLTTPRGATCIDRSFRTQAAQARNTFQTMMTVLNGWKANVNTRVLVSGWLTRFGRGAHTGGQGAGSVVTLPLNVLQMNQLDLVRTLIHESAHGAGGPAVEDKRMIGTSGFRTLADLDRLNNAYHFDGAARAYITLNHIAYLTVNVDPPPAVMAGAGVAGGGGNTVLFQQVFGQVEQMLLGARVHSENMLESMVTWARNDQSFPFGKWWWVAPMNLPSENSWSLTPDVQVEDIEKTNKIVTSIENIHGLLSNLNIQEVGPGQGLNEGNPLDILANTLSVYSHAGSNLVYTHNAWRIPVLKQIIGAAQVITGSGVNAEMVDELSKVYHRLRTPRGF